jgi:uncharacterized membrane protein
MSAEALEWLNLLARWVHVIAGIMWVGNSMLFNWLDRNLRDTDSDHPAKFGETWMLHSGGFYRVEKFKASASTLPDLLHWFKWQSYTTWVSGFCLLLIVYFQGRGAYLLDPEVSNLTYGDAVALSLSLLAGGWMFYDLLWRIPARRAWAQNLISLVALVGATYLVCDHLSGRAAYLLMGALLGSLMAGNVFFHIIPSQKEMVAAIQAGHDQDMALANRAKQRSIHNNYMTFPVLFAMISNHFGGLYGHELNWVILLILFFTSALIRHFMNIRFVWKPWLPASAGTLAAAAALLMAIFHMDTSSRAAYTPGLDPQVPTDSEPVEFARVWEVIHHRCVRCHSSTPQDPVLGAATGGVHFDAPLQVKAHADRIKIRAVVQRTMPLANQTGITEAERALLGVWVDQGAKIE